LFTFLHFKLWFQMYFDLLFATENDWFSVPVCTNESLPLHTVSMNCTWG
jgi:hypothetical protein